MKQKIRFHELIFMFLLGSLGYSLLEILFRGYTHWTMTLLGGICCAVLYVISACKWSVIAKGLAGAGAITALELTAGVIINIVFRWNVWDYSQVPMNFLGQICLPFTFMWFILSLAAMFLCSKVRGIFSGAIIIA